VVFGACELRARCERTTRHPPTAPLGRLASVWSQGSSAVLDMQDFGGSTLEKEATGAAHDVQTREHVFTVARDGVLNCIGIFIWVDLGIGAPAEVPECAAADAGDDAGMGGCSDVARFVHRFPFGARVGSAGSTAFAAAPTDARLNDFTSLCTAETMRDRTHASNWMNPLLMLPQPAPVHAGDRLRVRSRSSADGIQPSYAFELLHLPRKQGKGVPLGRLDVTFRDLYPYYD
jgi:hypothetical protein